MKHEQQSGAGGGYWEETQYSWKVKIHFQSFFFRLYSSRLHPRLRRAVCPRAQRDEWLSRWHKVLGAAWREGRWNTEEQMEGGEAGRAVGLLRLLTSWWEPAAPGDTGDEWTYLASRPECARCQHTVHETKQSAEPGFTAERHTAS